MGWYLALLQLSMLCSVGSHGRAAHSLTEMEKECIGVWEQREWGRARDWEEKREGKLWSGCRNNFLEKKKEEYFLLFSVTSVNIRYSRMKAKWFIRRVVLKILKPRDRQCELNVFSFPSSASRHPTSFPRRFLLTSTIWQETSNSFAYWFQ